MDATSSKVRRESSGAGSSGSGSSPKRRSARLSGRVVASNLQKQVTLKNFLGRQVTETPRTLLEAFASKRKDVPSVVKSDKTLELTASDLESTIVLNKSRERHKSFHEDSFLHPSQKQASLSSGRKRRTAPDDASVETSPIKTTNMAAGNHNWRRPRPIDRFNVKRQSRATIEAAIIGEISQRDTSSQRSPIFVANPTEESASSRVNHSEVLAQPKAHEKKQVLRKEDRDFEFSEESINTSEISGIWASESGKDGAGMERDVEPVILVPSSALEIQADMEMETPETGKSVECEENSDIATSEGGVSQGQATDARMSSHVEASSEQMPQLHAQVPSSSFKLSPRGQQLSFSMPKLSVVVQQLRVPVQQSNSPAPQLSMPTPQLSTSVPQLSTPTAHLSMPMPQLSKPIAQLSTSTPQLSTPRSQLSMPALQLSMPASQLSTPRSQLRVPVQRIYSPAPRLSSTVPQLSTVREEFSVTSTNELATTSRAGVAATSRVEVTLNPAMEVVVTLSEHGPEASIVETTGVEEASLSTSQVEEAEEREEPTTPRLPFTPRLPPKAKTPASVRKNRQTDMGEIQPETSDAARPKSRATGAASGGRPRSRRIQTSLPRSLMHSAFQFFAGMKVSKEALEEVDQISEMFWSNVVEDLETYAKHGHHSIVERSDVEVLMKRQRFVTENTSLNALVEKYLALEDRETLIPIARAGNRLE